MLTFPKLPEPLLFLLPFGLAELLLDPLLLDFVAFALGERFTVPLPFVLCFPVLVSFLAILPPDTNKKRAESLDGFDEVKRS